MPRFARFARIFGLAILVGTFLLPIAPQRVAAQGAASAELAAQQAVADFSGAPAESVIAGIIAQEEGWAYGTGTIPAGAEHDAPDVHMFLARDDGSGWVAAIRFTPGFDELLAQAPVGFPSPEIGATLDGFTVARDGSSDLGFPWAVGESWRFNGPHANGGSAIRGALDFFPASAAANAPVLAMRGGVVYRPCANMVMIDHGDGWTSYYYHLDNITVSQGQIVSRGQHIGGTSSQVGCGGWSTGPHVHIYLRYELREVAMDGIDIGGWTVENGALAYDGCLTRDDTTLCAEWFSSVPNDGTTGSWSSGGNGGGDPSGPVSASVSPTRTTVNNWVTYTLAGFPANATVDISWRRLSGSTIDMGTAQTDGSGAATGQFRVPATPGGPNQQITFSAGSVSRTALFEVAPRIKVNTSPGIRGQQVDVSLRGYAKQESVRIRWKKPDSSWVEVGTLTTSNTGSANLWVTVPLWAEDGNNSVRGDGTVFRQQTNVVYIEGGAFQAASVSEPTPTVTPAATATPVTIDRSSLPADEPLQILVVTDDTGAAPVTAATDSNPETAWQVDPAQATARMTVDLGQPVTLSTIAWLRMQTGCGVIERIESSLDGQSWTPLTPPSPLPEGSPGIWQALPATGDAQFVRWVVTTAPEHQALGCLAEVTVWGTPLTTPEPTDPATAEPEATSSPEVTVPPATTEPVTPEPALTETPTEAVTEPSESPAEPTEIAPPPEETAESSEA